ncbi:unnamed protein product (macronuclear) [Paramecium tetraurelia]|uniref:Potassium channel domain-containing protein n=1 Tax=Paramecium tetraurelia TaxID=5888 RepID=A0E2D3_PARTE|nr:uncharacterized protein GSPATT00022622001 [Paramecium tetraurelia]CAK89450.1 unnamed protein product [Paramecium tetraurelia]|eukprot:XP_001456847.1 hypothetical protein (macronuclear) [Paramecium tetraurelia strain d4-2]
MSQDVEITKQKTPSLSKKWRVKRQGSILSDSQSTFEDSRITLLLFEQYRIVEMTRFCVIFGTQIIAILEYECSFSDQFAKELEKETLTLLYIIFLMTAAAILLTLISYQVLLTYKKKAMVITPQAGLFDSNLVQGLAIEMLLILPTPTPFTQMIRVDFNQRYTGELRFYYLNEILTYILTFRVILLINITLKFSSFYSSQIGRLCRLYSTDFDTHLVFKLCMKDLPGYTLMGLFITGMLLFGYSMEIAERALQRNEVQHSVYSVMTSMWVTLTTIATVGYGEFYPTTDLGRISMAICVFWGVSYTSLFTAMLDSMFERMNCEEMVWALLEKTSATNVMKYLSQDLIVRIQKMKIKKLQNNNIHLIQDSINALKQMKRQYRNIDGEDSMSKAKRKFKDINFMFQEYYLLLKEFKRLQLINTINYHYVCESHPSCSQKINSHHLQTCDQQSKDEPIYQDSEQEESDLLVMEFHV